MLDLKMPEMDGLEVCKRIKGDPALGRTAVVILTSADDPHERAAGVAAGADAYLTKPFSPLELLTVVERMMARAA